MAEERQWSRSFAALRQLLLDFLASDASEIDWQQGALRLRARKSPRRLAAPVPVAAPAAAAAQESRNGASSDISVRSPLTGVIYLSPSPHAAPYLAVGDYVEAGQVVALVEAMKVYNEVKSQHAGRVVRILVNSGDLVLSDQPILELAE